MIRKINRRTDARYKANYVLLYDRGLTFGQIEEQFDSEEDAEIAATVLLEGGHYGTTIKIMEQRIVTSMVKQ